MTASVLAEHRRASFDAGMDGFASKPVDWFALSHEIARVLGLGSAQPDAELPPQERMALNRQAGLRRWNSKEDAFLEALAHFEAQHAGVAQALAAQASQADYRSMRMLAHKVRGVAANLGLELLADALGKLEAQVDGDSGKLYPGAEDALRELLAQLCVAARRRIGSDPRGAAGARRRPARPRARASISSVHGAPARCCAMRCAAAAWTTPPRPALPPR